MNWEALSAIFAIITFLFTIFLEWPRFKTRLTEASSGLRRFIWIVAGSVSFIGLIIFTINSFGTDLSKGFSKEYLIGLTMTCSGVSVIGVDVFLMKVKHRTFEPILLTAYFCLLLLGMITITIFSLYELVMK